MGKKEINIGLFTSVYSYFLYLLLKGYDENDIIIVHNTFPKEISKNINPIIVPIVTFKDGGIKQSIANVGIKQMIKGFSKYLFNYLKLRIILFYKTFNKNIAVYGHAFSLYAFMFYENKNSNIIEDGLTNYTEPICETHKINPIIDFILHIFGSYFINLCETYGSHKNIRNVYLTRENNHPLIKDKVKVVNMDTLWNGLNNEEQDKILKIFNINLEDFNFEDETVLILTQPLYEDGYLSLDDELEIYQNIITKFKNKTIIIKPHPRDPKDYNKIFPNVKIIDKNFPIEMLNLINIYPDIACTVVSYGILSFKNTKLYIYNKKLKNKDLIMARKGLLEKIRENNLKLIS